MSYPHTPLCSHKVVQSLKWQMITYFCNKKNPNQPWNKPQTWVNLLLLDSKAWHSLSKGSCFKVASENSLTLQTQRREKKTKNHLKTKQSYKNNQACHWRRKSEAGAKAELLLLFSVGNETRKKMFLSVPFPVCSLYKISLLGFCAFDSKIIHPHHEFQNLCSASNSV